MAYRATYTREAPSPRYLRLLDEYRLLHTEGAKAQGLSAEETFPGQSLPEHAPAIRDLIEATGARSLIDYGSGKGRQYEWTDLTMPGGEVVPSLSAYWGNPGLVLFDPGYPPLSERPSGPADGVICTDVLEHCPEEDMAWILDEIFSLANRFVFANVASYPAAKTLPSGENVHCTVRPAVWWDGMVAGVAVRYPQVRYRVLVEERRPKGLLSRGGKTTSVIEGGPVTAG
ncbi:MAG: hypothetical protein KDJ77_16080 [Rhodobiaceae bacterium]|nr:hypothetical protein [Rhodobiaceae bacterium]